MTTRIPLLLAVMVAVAAQAAPAHAWIFEDDGTSWPLFSFHQYGGDVNRPAATPDRPYFHGDDAVPLGMRWRDLEEAQAEAAADDAAAAAAAVRVRAAVPTHRGAVRHRRVVHRKPQICVPAKPVANR